KTCSANLHQQSDACALLAVDRDVYEGGDADQLQPAGRHVAPGDRDGLDGLVDGPGADGLNLHPRLRADHARDGARHRDRLRGRRDLQHLHRLAPLPRHCWNPRHYVCIRSLREIEIARPVSLSMLMATELNVTGPSATSKRCGMPV